MMPPFLADTAQCSDTQLTGKARWKAKKRKSTNFLRASAKTKLKYIIFDDGHKPPYMKRFTLLLISTLFITACRQAAHQASATKATAKEEAPEARDSVLFSNDTLRIAKIDSLTYFHEKASSKTLVDAPPYIEDLQRAKELLAGRLVFGEPDYREGKGLVDSTKQGAAIYSVLFGDGKLLTYHENPAFSEVGFYRYYPTEDVVLFEGGHSSDYAIDLRTGMMGADLAGNPAYISYSPSKAYRLNGWFPGQECSDYFIQRKTEQGYLKYINLPIHLTEQGFDLCTINDVFWTSDSTLYFRNTFFGSPRDSRLGFFKLMVH